MSIEPSVRVGILSDNAVTFSFNAQYSHLGEEVKGEQTVSYQDGKIRWNRSLYDQLLFESNDKKASFILKDVIIGLNFHWERKEDQEFKGSLKLIVQNDQIIAINIVKIEDYLTSVISSEMSASASLELLKAHAVISRSWLLAQIEKNKEIIAENGEYSSFTETENEFIRWYDREDHLLFDVCADDHCQRYQGITRASSNIATVRQAIAETRGELLTWGGKICDARFSKCCGGAVEEFQNCWENTSFSYLIKLRDNTKPYDLPDLTQEAEAIKWIKNRPSAFCNTEDKNILAQVLNNYDRETIDFYRWKITYSQEELSALVLKRSNIDFGVIQELIPIQRGTSGRLIKLKIVGSKKTLIIGKELEIRRTLSNSHLYSSAFYVEKEGTQFTLIGAGWGHGVGLCQIGAAVMGEKGYSYKQILLHYYVGAAIEKLY